MVTSLEIPSSFSVMKFGGASGRKIERANYKISDKSAAWSLIM